MGYTFRSLISGLLMIFCISVNAQPEHDALPADMMTEVLLILLYDEVAIDHLSGSERLRARHHNAAVRRANKVIEKAVAEYPFPHAVARRSVFVKENAAEILPQHRFVINSAIMEGFQDRDNVKGEKDIWMETTYVSDIYIWDRTTDMKYVVLREMDANRQLARFDDILRLMVKRMKKAAGR